MKLSRSGPLYQLSFLPRLFPVNCFLFEEVDHIVAIDAALFYSSSAIEGVTERTKKPLGKLLLTHGHEDHIGAVDKLVRRHPELPLGISVRDARLLAGDKSTDPGEKPLRGAIPTHVKARPTFFMKEGDQIGSLTVIAVPGHTPGSLAFFDETTGVLIAGDAFQTRGAVAVAGFSVPSFPFPSMATWDPAQALISARKLIALGPRLLAVGHGEMLENPLEAMTKAADSLERFLEKGNLRVTA